MKLVKAEDLQNLVIKIFEKRGVPKQESLIAAHSLVHAEVRGVHCGGGGRGLRLIVDDGGRRPC